MGNQQQYREFLKSETWKKKKRQAKYWHGNRCAICRSKKIHIHHKTYKNGWGNEDQKYHLIPLCKTHHTEVHLFAKQNNMNIYHATEKMIKLKKPKEKQIWKTMSPFQRELFLGKGL